MKSRLVADTINAITVVGLMVTIPYPSVAPLDVPITRDDVEDVWDTFVKPDQDAGGLQSIEMRCLMGILRSVYKGALDD